MSAKRKRLTVETAEAAQAALPAVCYLPSIHTEGTGTSSTASDVDGHSLAKRMKYDVYAKSNKLRTVQLVHAALDDIEYVGRSDGDENAGVQPCSYVLAVYKPEESKLQLVSVAGERLFRLDTRLNGLVYAPTGAGQSEDDNVREARRMAAKKLVDAFGSTRRRRQLTAREAGVVDANRISGGEAVLGLLGEVAAKGAAEGLTREEVERRAFQHRTIPPHNPEATTAMDAYPLTLLLSRGPRGPGSSLLEGAAGADGGAGAAAGEEGGEDGGASLVAALNTRQVFRLMEEEEEMKLAREKQWLAAYVLDRLTKLAALRATAPPDLLPKIKQAARYLALLAALFKLNSKGVLQVKEEGVPGLARELHLRESLLEFFLEMFYVRSDDPLRGVRYERTDAQRQLLLSYILAVAIVAEDGFMDRPMFEQLRSELKMDASKLASAMQQLGCSTKAGKLQVERSGAFVDVPAYEVTLLRQTSRVGVVKTLAQCFPEIKSRGKKGGR